MAACGSFTSFSFCDIKRMAGVSEEHGTTFWKHAGKITHYAFFSYCLKISICKQQCSSQQQADKQSAGWCAQRGSRAPAAFYSKPNLLFAAQLLLSLPAYFRTAARLVCSFEILIKFSGLYNTGQASWRDWSLPGLKTISHGVLSSSNVMGRWRFWTCMGSAHWQWTRDGGEVLPRLFWIV